MHGHAELNVRPVKLECNALFGVCNVIPLSRSSLGASTPACTLLLAPSNVNFLLAMTRIMARSIHLCCDSLKSYAIALRCCFAMQVHRLERQPAVRQHTIDPGKYFHSHVRFTGSLALIHAAASRLHRRRDLLVDSPHAIVLKRTVDLCWNDFNGTVPVSLSGRSFSYVCHNITAKF